MTNLTDEQRAEFMKAWEALDARDAVVMAARLPIEEQLRPFIEQSAQIDEEREELIERFGVEFVGKCAHCDKPLFTGDRGSRPYDDEDSIVYCAEHGLTYGDLRQSWEDQLPGDDEDDRRDAALAMVKHHLNGGGALTDLCPTYEL